MNRITLKRDECDKAEIYHYPDGQKNIKLYLDKIDVKKPIIISCSIRNFSELETLLCLVSALRKNDFYIDKINFMYLFGMRSDRAFELGMPNYFKDVVAPIINSMDIPKIDILHPHSNSFRTIKGAIFKNVDYLKSRVCFPCIFIGGDQSTKNIIDDSNQIILDIKFNKKREGRNIIVSLDHNDLLKINNNANEERWNNLIIFDDICDGGATFIEEAKYLKERFSYIKLHLYVTHAIFSNGVDIVADHFERIYCTNSYQDINHPKVTQLEVI